MKKPKLLITTDSFLPRIDGIARFLMEVVPFLSKQFTITILAPDFPGEKVNMTGVTIHYIPLSALTLGDYQFATYCPSLIKKYIQQNDLIFNQSLGTIGIAAIRAGAKAKKPVISFIHSIDWELASQSLGGNRVVRWLAKVIARKIYAKCTKLLFPSQQAELRYQEQRIIKPSRIIPLGVDTHRFIPSHSKAVAKKKIGIDPNKLVIGFCGRIGREKDLGTLLQAFQEIKNMFPVILLIVGSGLTEEVQDEDIILAGRQQNVVPYLQAMDIYVLPSLTETTSLSTLEAMSCGLPVICTPVGAIREYIKHKENGYLFPRKNVSQLVKYLQILLRNPKRREELGSAARKTVHDRFQWPKTMRQLEKTLSREIK